MTLLVITGTGTEVGKTVATAAVAALARDAGKRVAVVKPAQTGVQPGEPGDVAEVVRLAGEVTTVELARYPDPLSPEAAARRAGLPPVRPAEAAAELEHEHDVVLVEGTGGLLVRFDHTGGTLADLAWALGAPVLLVASAGLGTLNTTALTAEALRHRGIDCLGVIIGSWPERPGLADRSNLLDLLDLPVAARAPLLGVLPHGVGKCTREDFLGVARACLAPQLGGEFHAVGFAERHSSYSRAAERVVTPRE